MQCQIMFSLLVFLGLSIRVFLILILDPSGPTPSRHVHGELRTRCLRSERIFRAWHERFPKSISHLHCKLIKPCMDENALKSDNVIDDPRLKVRLKDWTLKYIRDMLDPATLPAISLEDAPYTCEFLSVFTTSPTSSVTKACPQSSSRPQRYTQFYNSETNFAVFFPTVQPPRNKNLPIKQLSVVLNLQSQVKLTKTTTGHEVLSATIPVRVHGRAIGPKWVRSIRCIDDNKPIIFIFCSPQLRLAPKLFPAN
jgi:hypothetical protein